MRAERRVAITGLGVVSPGGSSVDDFWQAMLEGKSAAELLELEVDVEIPVRIGCRARGFDPTRRMTPKEARRTDPFAQFALSAALDAFEDAGCPEYASDRAAVVVGSGAGGTSTAYQQAESFFVEGPSSVNPLSVPMAMPNAAPALIALSLSWRGPSMSIATACASGAHAIGEGFRMVRDGSVDIALVGGSEAAVNAHSLNAFARLQALSTREDDPARASRPFDKCRDGFVMGEGAGFCVIEDLHSALTRGARVYGLLSGYGRTTDAHHVVMPEPSGSGAARCIELALDDAGISAGDVDHVNAHGTSTRLNDRSEARALTRVFGEGTVPPATSAKGVIGHLVGAAGAVELVASVLSSVHRMAPPTANYEFPDESIGLDVVADAPRELLGGVVISNSFGFGGHNATLVVEPLS